MANIGYHASHEQFHPGVLLDCIQEAEAGGFSSFSCSDHFHPWSSQQGHSGYAWSWLGAAMAKTELPASVVTCPFGRYHPAIIAQACATLAAMFVGRFTIAVGSGEALNEHITGLPWPEKSDRNTMLRESVDVMRALWRGENVSHRGAIVVDRAQLYTLPQQAPRVFAAALSPATAKWAAEWADGLITISGQRDSMRRIIDAFREGGGDDKPIHVQAKVAYAPIAQGESTARNMAYEQWRTNVFDSQTAADLPTPASFEQRAADVKPADMDQAVRISCDPNRHAEWLAEDFDLGVDMVMIHNVGTNQEESIAMFAEHVLPQFR